MDITTENAFWLGVLLDHIDFMDLAIPAKYSLLRQRLEELRSQGQSIVEDTSSDDIQVSEAALKFAQDVTEFKKGLLERKLTELSDIQMDPTFISHMLNEVEEYITILTGFLLHGEVPKRKLLDYHKLWLLDIDGHLVTIKKNLDPIEKILRKAAGEKGKKFKHFFLKALELIGYLRATQDFPELRQFNEDMIKETEEYLLFISELNQLLLQGTLPGTITVQMLEHMTREQEYYLSKIRGDLSD
jgi:hypothetical protein